MILSNIKYILVSDIDGTLTKCTRTYELSLKAIKAIRILESKGIKVTLASGNSLPISLAISKYIGCTGPTIAENGCIIAYNGDRIKILCTPKDVENVIKAYNIIKKRFSNIVKESWQNRYRVGDFAFIIKKEYRNKYSEIVERIRKTLHELGLQSISITFSGFAIHLTPKNINKGTALLEIMKYYNIDRSKIIAIGDSETDIPLFKYSGIRIAVANANPKLKDLADYVVSKPCGLGFYEAAKMILKFIKE